MRNKIIQKAIEDVIAETDYNPTFKRVFKSYVINKFDHNVGDSDFDEAISQLKPEEIRYENDN